MVSYEKDIDRIELLISEGEVRYEGIGKSNPASKLINNGGIFPFPHPMIDGRGDQSLKFWQSFVGSMHFTFNWEKTLLLLSERDSPPSSPHPLP